MTRLASISSQDLMGSPTTLSTPATGGKSRHEETRQIRILDKCYTVFTQWILLMNEKKFKTKQGIVLWVHLPYGKVSIGLITLFLIYPKLVHSYIYGKYPVLHVS